MIPAPIRYLGWSPYISFTFVQAVFASMTGFLTGFAEMTVFALRVKVFTGPGNKFVTYF